MKKNLFCLTLMLMIIASNCFAMSFSQPVKIGEIGYRGGLDIKGATSIKDYSTVKDRGFMIRALRVLEFLSIFISTENIMNKILKVLNLCKNVQIYKIKSADSEGQT